MRLWLSGWSLVSQLVLRIHDSHESLLHRGRVTATSQGRSSKWLGPVTWAVLQLIRYCMRFKRVTASVISRKEAHREYRKRNLVFFVLFLGWIPFVSLVAIPLGRQLNSDWLAETMSVSWFCGVIAAAIWRLNWRCPRCDKKFYTKWWYKNAVAMRCVNCSYKPGE